jgi:hypothetical protein
LHSDYDYDCGYYCKLDKVPEGVKALVYCRFWEPKGGDV